MPPKEWNITDLQLADALDVGHVREPDLSNEIDTLFARENWLVEENEWITLLPSLRLVSRWIEVALPYIATFLPSDDVQDQLQAGGKRDREISLKRSVKQSDLKQARQALDQIAVTTKWQVNYEMLKDRGWLGITRLAPEERPWGALTPKQIKKSDAAARRGGFIRRPLTVGIMGEYIDALDNSDPRSERYLRAAFMAAVTITHEVAHVIFHQDYRSWTADSWEPYVGDAHWSELGFSLVAAIFNGYNPSISDLGKYMFDFFGPLHWEELPKGTRTQKMPFKPLYSISIFYIQDVFTESWWNDLGDPNSPVYVGKALSKLRPRLSSKSPPATAMQVQFHKRRGKLEWKIKHRDRGIKGDLGALLTEKEVEVALQRRRTILDPIDLTTDPPVANTERRLDHLSQFPGDIASSQEAEVESVEETFGQPRDTEDDYIDEDRAVELPKRRLPSQINDGWLDQDSKCLRSYPSNGIEKPQNVSQTVTRITVKYRPEGPELPYNFFVPVDRVKRGYRYNSDSSKGDSSADPYPRSTPAWENPNYITVEALIERWSIRNIENRFTRLQAYEFCEKNNIPHGRMQSSVIWQQSKLNTRDDPADKAIVESMRYHVFTQSQDRYSHLEPSDIQALLKLKYELRASVSNWGGVALLKYCRDHGITQRGGRSLVSKHVKEWFTNDIEEMKRKHAAAVDPAGKKDVSWDFDWPKDTSEEDRFDDPIYWSEERLDRFLKHWDLPPWGNLKTKVAKVVRFFQDQTRDALTRNTRSIYARTSESGWETYAFHAIPHLTTVASLKSALFITGRFKSEDILTLTFGADVSRPLEDHELISKNRPKRWSDVRLTVSKPPEQSIPTSPATEWYVPRGRVPLSQILQPSRIPRDPAERRRAEVRAGKRKGTVGERMEMLQEDAEQLVKTTRRQEGLDRLRSGSKAVPSTSGIEILDNLEEMEERKKRRYAEVLEEEGREAYPWDEMASKRNQRRERGDHHGLPQIGTSHMADLYKKLWH